MNIYEVFYTYTVPTEETPFCTVENTYNVESYSHNDAKEQVRDRLRFFNHDNLKIVRSKIVRKNSDCLIREDGVIKGVGACFTFNNKEIAVIVDNKDQLQDVLNLINRNSSVRLDESKCVNVKIVKDDIT